MGNTPTHQLQRHRSSQDLSSHLSQSQIHHRPKYSQNLPQSNNTDGPIMLTHFRGELSFMECLYVFNSLIQKCNNVLQKEVVLRLNRNSFSITPFGQVNWQTKINQIGSQTELKYNLVSTISYLNALISELFDRKSNNLCEYNYFKQKLKSIVHQNHSQQTQLYHKIVTQTNRMLQAHGMKTNLIATYLRAHSKKSEVLWRQTQSDLHISRAMHKQKRHKQTNPSLLRSTSQKSNLYVSDTMPTQNMKYRRFVTHSNPSQLQKTSLKHKKMTSKNTYQQKVVHTQGQCYQDFNQRMSQSQSVVIKQPANLESSLKEYYYNFVKEEKRMDISHQYSMNIYCQVQRINQGRVKFEKTKEEYKTKHKEVRANKDMTSIREKCETKSVLQLLARSVEIREDSMSYSQII